MAQFAPDGVPTIDGCRPAVLRYMADGEVHSLQQIIRGVADVLELGEDLVAQKISSGQGRLENRVGWACSSFYGAGLLEKERRGWYRITDDGRAVNARGLLEYSEQDMLEWPTWRAYTAEIGERRKRSGEGAAETGSTAAVPSPDELDPLATISTLIDELNASVETELRTTLQTSSPEFFERAVLEVLWAMGYGGALGQKEHVGRSGDGGIDGVIRQDPLGLQNVYVQAKRYSDTNTVGSPEINGFYGALHRRGADRGVFITTSTFSPAAHEAARQLGGKIVLIDGIRLTSLMLRYGVGVEERNTFVVFDINRDFFDE